jgi:hypothetical protein
MEVMRAGGTALPLNGGGTPVKEVQQGCHLQHRWCTGRAPARRGGGGAHRAAARRVGGRDGLA